MKNLNPYCLFILFLLLHLALPLDVESHTRTISFSEWRHLSENMWEVKAVLPIKEFIKLYGTDNWDMDNAAAYAYSHFTLDTARCTSSSNIRPVSTTHVGTEFIFKWEIHCDSGMTQTPVIQVDPFFSFAPSHLHVAKFFIENKKIEKIITPGKTRINLDELVTNPKRISSSRKILDFILAGIHHLIIGPEHLLFVLALSLLASNFITLLKIVTAFTIAHAISLTPVLMGWVTTDSRSVEALIGLSIFVVAIEASLRLVKASDEKTRYTRNARLMTAAAIFFASFLAYFQVIPVKPLALSGVGIVVLLTAFRSDQTTAVSWIHAFGFGLVHGLGIAGTLGDKVIGVDIMIVLAGFNLGIEVGQIMIAIVILVSLGVFVKALAYVEAQVNWSSTRWIKLSELPLYGVCSCLIMAGVYLFSIRSIIL